MTKNNFASMSVENLFKLRDDVAKAIADRAADLRKQLSQLAGSQSNGAAKTSANVNHSRERDGRGRLICCAVVPREFSTRPAPAREQGPEAIRKWRLVATDPSSGTGNRRRSANRRNSSSIRPVSSDPLEAIREIRSSQFWNQS